MFVAGVGRIAGAVVAGIMFSAAGLFVTFLNLHLNIGSYQAIVAGLALVLTAVQNPDGITGTSTGKGPAVALAKLQDRALGEFRTRRPAIDSAHQPPLAQPPAAAPPAARAPRRCAPRRCAPRRSAARRVGPKCAFGPARVSPKAHLAQWVARGGGVAMPEKGNQRAVRNQSL